MPFISALKGRAFWHGYVKGYVSEYYILVAIFLIMFKIPKTGGTREEIYKKRINSKKKGDFASIFSLFPSISI
jgi:hypothetical protein